MQQGHLACRGASLLLRINEYEARHPERKDLLTAPKPSSGLAAAAELLRRKLALEEEIEAINRSLS